MSRISVIIPLCLTDTYHRNPKTLESCLESLRLQVRQPNEIIVSDRGSDPKYLAEIKSYCQKYKARHLYLPESGPWNRSRAINAGIRQSSANSNYIAITDADMLMPPLYIDKILNKCSPKTFVNLHTQDLPKGAKIGNISKPETWKTLQSVSTKHHWWGAGICAMPRSWAISVRGYDEFYKIWGCEDTDMRERAIKSGLKIVTLPNLAFHQFHLKSSNFKAAHITNLGYMQSTHPLVRNVEHQWGYTAISIIVITHQKGQLLHNTLTEVIKQMSVVDQLIVIDDGGEDKSFVPEDKRLKYISVEHKGYRLSTMRNMGIRNARNEYIALIDGDCLPQPGWLSTYRHNFGIKTLLCGRIDWGDKKDSRFNYATKTMTGNINIGAVYGGNIAFCKSNTLGIGGFDEAYNGGWGCEDTDFAMKMLRKQNNIKFLFAAAVTHQPHPRTIAVSQENLELLTRRWPNWTKPIWINRPVSIIVVSWQENPLYKELIGKVLQQISADDELVVVDDDFHKSLGLAKNSRIKYINYPHQRYRMVHWLNRTITTRKKSYIVLLSPNCIPQDNWLRGIKENIGHNTLISGRIEKLKDGKKLLDDRFDYARHQPAPWLWPYWVDYANMAFPKEMAQKIGLFDPFLDRNHGFQDKDFALRWHKLGGEVIFSFEAAVTSRQDNVRSYDCHHNQEIFMKRWKKEIEEHG